MTQQYAKWFYKINALGVWISHVYVMILFIKRLYFIGCKCSLAVF